ncbi:hypothetical protein JYU34_011152 [Plutella xylostella]|uniref:Secreted protein n=1 Tax=Plutella xylostella TaxID=51655 RepID=A0ABQ7QG78_PLUXY|nr:hypothetical protein JYU34_011152 [Plutella xylostella]
MLQNLNCLFWLKILLLVSVFFTLTGSAVRQPAHLPRYDASCRGVCADLPPGDAAPVCMMLSRFKNAYHMFVNLCHARRTMCFDHIFLHTVHISRCREAHIYYRPIV